ncbi:JAB domain-containing protein [Sphingosinicella ginsenosidimutans]|uniref:JAB domain-containing protein n=1 Tax=Allosphingosinicella ginsenosidimutans TaxID=1176539 RepID=UPI001315A151|nr:JAB domain-containing protein [Sphingosinicella ginsenosidimutans]
MLAAPPHRLLRACGDRAVTRHLASIGEAFRLSLRDAAFEGERITGTAGLARYLAATMGHLPREEVRALFLSAKNELLADETLFAGSVDSSVLEARPIIHRALDLAATGLIVVHNHPSGCAEPSAADVAATRRLAKACKELSIIVHDHIVVARGSWSSFRDLGLL